MRRRHYVPHLSIALIVGDAGSPITGDSEFKTWLESIGHTVTYVSDTDTEVLSTAYDCGFVLESSSSSSIGSKYDAVGTNVLPVIHSEVYAHDDGGYTDTAPSSDDNGGKAQEWNSQVFNVPAFTNGSDYTMIVNFDADQWMPALVNNHGDATIIWEQSDGTVQCCVGFEVGDDKNNAVACDVRSILWNLARSNTNDTNRLDPIEDFTTYALQWVVGRF